MSSLRSIASLTIRKFNTFRKPGHLAVILRDAARSHRRIRSDQEHLLAAVEWLCRSQDKTDSGGSSAGYSFETGWMKPYPETTGYIIPTFLNYAAYTNQPGFSERAIEMGQWEINIQLPSGAMRGGRGMNPYPVVFNTGQVILGWLALYVHTESKSFLNAATKAADWLLSVQDSDGKWSRHTFMNTTHAYHTRVAWSLFKLSHLTQLEQYAHAAHKNIAWVLTQSRRNSWFDSMGFSPQDLPYTHTIAYTLRGLLESAPFLEPDQKQKAIDHVLTAAETLMRLYELGKKTPYAMPRHLPGILDESWRPHSEASCLTSNAQIAILWLRVFTHSGDARYVNAALKLLDQLKSTQNLTTRNSGIRGGIAGSFPIWGPYLPYAYPNWAAKFFVDALMLQEKTMSRIFQEQE